jgi:outer membrane protease
MQRMIVLGCIVVLYWTAAAALAAESASDVEADYWVGLDAWHGKVQYEIGGWTKQDGVLEHNHFPVSRLEWPINAVSLQLGATVGSPKWDVRASFGATKNDDAGTMKDSDWEIPDNPKVLTTYSESDAELSAWQLDASIRYWIPFGSTNPKEQIRLGGGAGMLYQDFDWEARDTDQWYPQNPEMGHDKFPGKVITYEAQVLMPYVEVGGQWRHERFSAEARLGLAPWLQVEDVDDHKLRYIRAETTSDGLGAFLEILARYTFANNLFLQASLWTMSFETTGTEKDHVYDGEDVGTRWEIEHEVKSTQSRLTLAAGMAF